MYIPKLFCGYNSRNEREQGHVISSHLICNLSYFVYAKQTMGLSWRGMSRDHHYRCCNTNDEGYRDSIAVAPRLPAVGTEGEDMNVIASDLFLVMRHVVVVVFATWGGGKQIDIFSAGHPVWRVCSVNIKLRKKRGIPTHVPMRWSIFMTLVFLLYNQLAYTYLGTASHTTIY